MYKKLYELFFQAVYIDLHYKQLYYSFNKIKLKIRPFKRSYKFYRTTRISRYSYPTFKNNIRCFNNNKNLKDKFI